MNFSYLFRTIKKNGTVKCIYRNNLGHRFFHKKELDKFKIKHFKGYDVNKPTDIKTIEECKKNKICRKI